MYSNNNAAYEKLGSEKEQISLSLQISQIKNKLQTLEAKKQWFELIDRLGMIDIYIRVCVFSSLHIIKIN